MNNIHVDTVSSLELKQLLEENYGLPASSYYLSFNGKLINSDAVIDSANIGSVQIIPRVLGGKGGFGSMLRAIGAQIEKTTNREACRDLSGRRLRDINEEQRFKNWINQQAEREKEAKERKQKKLEKLCEPPKHEFVDKEYDKERTELPEIVEDAVLKGLQASTSSISTKRKTEQKNLTKKKKPKLWVDEELDEDLSFDENYSSEDDEKESSKKNEKDSNKHKTKVDKTENTGESEVANEPLTKLKELEK